MSILLVGPPPWEKKPLSGRIGLSTLEPVAGWVFTEDFHFLSNRAWTYTAGTVVVMYLATSSTLTIFSSEEVQFSSERVVGRRIWDWRGALPSEFF